MLTVGLDVHQSSSNLCVLDATGKTLRQERVQGGWDKLLLSLQRLDHPFQICFEASTGYGSLHDQLLPLAAKVLVANPKKTRLIFQCKRKSNRIDAAKLATLLHVNQVPAVHVPPQQVRSWRGLIEYRRTLVDKRVAAKNQIRALLRSFGIKGPNTRRLWTKAGTRWLLELPWPTPMESLRLHGLLQEISDLNKLLQRANASLDQFAKQHPLHSQLQLLQSVPGVGPRTAEAFLAYIDDPHRFKAGSIGAYFGLVPSEDSTGNSRHLGHITHEGPGTVRKYLAEAAWRGCQDSPTFKAAFNRFLRGNKLRRKIAITALAHWLARVLLAILRSQQPFKESDPLPDPFLPPAPAPKNLQNTRRS